MRYENDSTAPHVAVVTACPRCGGRLYERHNRRDGSTFLGCEAYPRCRWTAPQDAEIEALAREVLELRERVEHLAAATPERPSAGAPVSARDLRGLLARFHPDRFPSGTVPVHDVAVELSALLSRARAA